MVYSHSIQYTCIRKMNSFLRSPWARINMNPPDVNTFVYMCLYACICVYMCVYVFICVYNY